MKLTHNSKKLCNQLLKWLTMRLRNRNNEKKDNKVKYSSLVLIKVAKDFSPNVLLSN